MKLYTTNCFCARTSYQKKNAGILLVCTERSEISIKKPISKYMFPCFWSIAWFFSLYIVAYSFANKRCNSSPLLCMMEVVHLFWENIWKTLWVIVLTDSQGRKVNSLYLKKQNWFLCHNTHSKQLFGILTKLLDSWSWV